MSLIQVIDLSLEFGGNYILRNISCTVERNSRIGLIGANGSGKSTLIRLMLGLLQPTEGKVLRAKTCRVAYLPQNMQLEGELRLVDYIKTSRPEIGNLEKQITTLSNRLNLDHDLSTEQKLAEAVERFTALGGFEWDNEIKYVLESLGIGIGNLEKPLGLFSGGEQTRICLASMLLMPHDVLILDEPTNHLDIAMITWLENYLLKQDKPFLIVSHDRRFLDNTVSSIYLLRDAGLAITKGNYSSFKAADEIARMSMERQYERQQKFLEETRAFIQKNIAGQKTNQAKSRLKMLQRIEIVQKPGSEKRLRLPLNSSSRSGNDVYTLQDVSFGIPGGIELAREVNIRAHFQDRICILGPNGCGKTTLLKILLGEHDISKGLFKTGASLSIGYFDQHQVSLEESLTVMETLWQIVPDATRGYVLSWLARFGFTGDDVEKRVAVLSGGEKSRLYLCVLIHQNPNLLIMDEPTNHLDIGMADSLLDALKAYRGTIIFVSHDRYFLCELADKFWVFCKKANGRNIYTSVEQPDTDAQAAIGLAFAAAEVIKKSPTPREKKRKINPWHLEQIHKNIEAQSSLLEGLNLDLNRIHERLSSPQTYADESSLPSLREAMQRLEEEIREARSHILDLEDQYLSMSYED
ncbi:MAG: ABC-F family ATP-binding cassette domain-containing protein [Candidatus Cloacimonadaceae bacterium]|nr:ABC-F family ATP-binding cassette domain-containing protein [Candidatus Cloacimonadaceae bacterium]